MIPFASAYTLGPVRLQAILRGVALATLFACFACAEERDRPDTVAVCAQDCDPGLGQTAGMGSPSDNGTSSTTGSGGDDVTLSGNLGVFFDDRFDPGDLAPFAGLATVVAGNANSQLVSAPYDGTSFALRGILAGEATRVLVVPDDPDNLPMPTLLRVDTRESATVTLPLVNSGILAAVFASVTSQAVVDADRAQLVLRFVDGDRQPVAGVKVDVAPAEFVVYAQGAGWTDDFAAATDPSGLVVAANIAASDFPGSTFAISARGSVVGSWVVAAIRGAASYDVLVTP